jgi:hypothetical protein
MRDRERIQAPTPKRLNFSRSAWFRERFDAAMASAENRAAAKDLMSFAKELVTLVIAE